MKLAPSPARRAAAAVLTASALLATGCSAINYQATTHEYSASDGIRTDAEDVKVRHLAFVAGEEGGPARLIGLVHNNATVPAGEDPQDYEVEVGIEAEGDSFSVTVGPGEAVNLEHDEEFVVESIGAAPGSFQPVTLTVNGTTEEISASVLSGVLAEYRHLLPDEYDEAELVGHLDHCPLTWGSGAAHDPHVSEEEVGELCTDWQIEYAEQREYAGHLRDDDEGEYPAED